MERQKLVFIIPTIRHGGAELFLLRLSALAQHKYEIHLVVIGGREGLFLEFEQLEIKIYYLGFEKVSRFPLALIQLKRVLKKVQPDVMQSFLYLADILSGLASYGLKIRLRVWSLRGTDLASGTTNYKLVIQRVAAKLSKRIPNLIISCSNQVSDFHVKLGYPKSKVFTIGNFVSGWALHAKSDSLFLSVARPMKFKIGIAARYELGKGHLALLEAVLIFLENNPLVTVDLCFSGKGCESEGRLSRDFTKILSDNTFFKNGRLNLLTSGLLSGSDLVDWFCNLDVYFMASDSLEGFPNSLAEAVSIGLPALATPVGAAVDFLPKERISFDSTSISMAALLERFCQEDLESRKSITSELRDDMLLTYNESEVFSAYESAWEAKK